jgi:hypothetical protein
MATFPTEAPMGFSRATLSTAVVHVRVAQLYKSTALEKVEAAIQ